MGLVCSESWDLKYMVLARSLEKDEVIKIAVINYATYTGFHGLARETHTGALENLLRRAVFALDDVAEGSKEWSSLWGTTNGNVVRDDAVPNSRTTPNNSGAADRQHRRRNAANTSLERSSMGYLFT